MRKTYASGFYWLVTLAASFVLLRLITSAVMSRETLLRLFAYSRHYESARDMSNSILVLGMRPCTVFFGEICGAMYNYRCGHVLLAREGAVRFGAENMLACLLCAVTGGMAAAYYLLSISSLGFTMFIVGACIAWVAVPIVAVFCGLNRLDGAAADALRGERLYYPRPSRARARTLSGAFRDIADWNSRPFRLIVSVVFFSSLAMLMHGLAEGPLSGIFQAAVDYAAAADKPLWEALAILALNAAPYLPMVSGLFCAVFFEKLFAALSHRHPAVLLLSCGPIAAAAAYAALIVLVVVGAYSVFLLMIIFLAICLLCSQSKSTADDLYKRMMKRQHILYEESLTLKVVLLVGFALPLVFMLGG